MIAFLFWLVAIPCILIIVGAVWLGVLALIGRGMFGE